MAKKKSLSNIARTLHRDLGYFFIGVTLLYAITGFILSVRGLGWFKEVYKFETTISQNIPIDKFKTQLLTEAKNGRLSYIYKTETKKVVKKNIKRLVFVEKQNKTLLFHSKYLKLNYNPNTGLTHIEYKAYPAYLQVFLSAHLSSNNTPWFYMGIIYSLVLAFFAISSLFMVKGKYGFERRGIYLFGLGILSVAFFIFISFYI